MLTQSMFSVGSLFDQLQEAMHSRDHVKVINLAVDIRQRVESGEAVPSDWDDFVDEDGVLFSGRDQFLSYVRNVEAEWREMLSWRRAQEKRTKAVW